jgi:hypothetical protein
MKHERSFGYMWMAKDVVWLEKSIGIGTVNKKVTYGKSIESES